MTLNSNYDPVKLNDFWAFKTRLPSESNKY